MGERLKKIAAFLKHATSTQYKDFYGLSSLLSSARPILLFLPLCQPHLVPISLCLTTAILKKAKRGADLHFPAINNFP
jgi:hypothetical protein